MKEYIDEEAFIAEIDRRIRLSWMGKAIGETIKFHIEKQPAADVVERKRGEWVDVVFDPVWKKMKATCTSCSHRGEIRVKSNYCGFVVPDSDFCPSCGADMRGESDG